MGAVDPFEALDAETDSRYRQYDNQREQEIEVFKKAPGVFVCRLERRESREFIPQLDQS